MLEQPVFGTYHVVPADLTRAQLDQTQRKRLAWEHAGQGVNQVTRCFGLRILTVRGLVLGDHADMREPVARLASRVLVVYEQIAEAEYAASGVVVDDCHALGARRMFGHQRTKQTVRPGGFGAAMEDAARVDILAAVHCLASDVMAVAPEKARNRRVVVRELGLGPVGRIDVLRDRLVVRIGRMRLRMIDEVSVQVDVVFGDAAPPGEAVRVDGVDQQHGGVVCLRTREPAIVEPRHVATGAGVAFDAMGARYQDQQLACIARAKPGDIGRAILAIRPLAGADVARQQLGATTLHGGQKFGTRLCIGICETGSNAVHGGSPIQARPRAEAQ